MLDNGRLGFMFSPGNVEELKQVFFGLKDQNLNLRRLEILDWFNSELSNKAIARKIRLLCEN